MKNGAEIMVGCLEAEGVEIVFGYPGAAICPFYDALYDSSIRHVLVRSEQNAAHMASGYARASGRPGVCVATSGPGATNLITGIATAYMDSVPMIAVTGQVNLEQLGRDVFQEADITGACESFTKHSYLVKRAADLPRVFREAFHIASTGRPGPVLIDVPQDVQETVVREGFHYPERAEIEGYRPKTKGHPMQIRKAAQAIREAKRPVICCGGGVVLSNAREEMAAFARKSGMPIVSTMMGIGVMPMHDPLYLGMIGKFGRSYANRAVGEADLILLCGARVGDRAIAVPNQIAEQAKVASTGRPGPVLIDVPQDVQETVVREGFHYPERAEIEGYRPKTKGHPMQIRKAAQAIREAKRPVICCGGGVVLSNAREEMAAFARKSGMPIVSTMMGIGVMPMHDPLYLGMIGKFGRSYANRAVGEADLILLCGARVGDRAIAVPNQIAEQAKVIHIDIDPAEIGKNMRVDIPIVGDIKSVLSELAEQAEPADCRDWVDRVLRYKNEYEPRGEDRMDAVEPRSFIRALSRLMDGDAILAADPGQSQIWAAINFTQREGRFLTSGGLGTMGYALPAALGAKLAKPRRQAVAVCGDGAFQMSLCELATVKATNVPLKIVVMDNRRLGMVREFQNQAYRGRHIATHMEGNPDFVALCRAYGIQAALAENNAQAELLAGEMLASPGPYVLVCRVDPETPSV